MIADFDNYGENKNNIGIGIFSADLVNIGNDEGGETVGGNGGKDGDKF